MIALGSDHGGYALKQHIIEYLDAHGLDYRDFGCHSTESCDYPVFAKAAAEAVASGECERGIVICTTGIGISIAANKVHGVRCALCTDPLMAEMAPFSLHSAGLAAIYSMSFPPSSSGKESYMLKLYRNRSAG